MTDIERAESIVARAGGNMLSRLDALYTECMAHAAIARSNADDDVARRWHDAAEGVLPLLDMLAARAGQPA